MYDNDILKKGAPWVDFSFGWRTISAISVFYSRSLTTFKLKLGKSIMEHYWIRPRVNVDHSFYLNGWSNFETRRNLSAIFGRNHVLSQLKLEGNKSNEWMRAVKHIAFLTVRIHSSPSLPFICKWDALSLLNNSWGSRITMWLLEN